MNGTYKENRMNSQRPAARRQTVNMRNVYVASFFAAAALLLVLSMFLFFNVSEIKGSDPWRGRCFNGTKPCEDEYGYS